MSDTEQNSTPDQEETQRSREDTQHTIAEKLKNSRLDQNISLQDVEKTLNIRRSYLEAIESGDWSNLPGEMYALGFVRQYAKHLNCDLKNLLNELKLNPYALTKPLTYPDPPIAPSKKWMIACAIAFVVLLIAFNVFQSQPTKLPSQILQEQGQTQTSPNEQEQAVSIPKASANILPTPVPPAVKVAPATTTNTQATTPTNTTSIQKPTPQVNQVHRYQFTAVLDKVWLQIHSVNNHALLREALLQKGQSIQLDSEQALSITCGNIPALEVQMDGSPIIKAGSASQSKQVVHDFILQTPDTH